MRRLQSLHENKFALHAEIFLEKIFLNELLVLRRNQNYRRVLQVVHSYKFQLRQRIIFGQFGVQKSPRQKKVYVLL